MNNINKKLDVGNSVVNNQGYNAIIIDKFKKKRKSNPTKSDSYLEIKFIESGYAGIYYASNIKNGKFKDYGSPTVYGVGYDFAGSKQVPLKVREAWHQMLRRCYSENFPDYSNYGGRGVSVDDRWLHLENFAEDVKIFKNYKEFIDKNKKWQYSLDKDILGDGTLYSKDTCIFATYKEQNNATRRVRPVRAISPEGEIKVFNSIKQASQELYVYTSSIHRVLQGVYSQAGGYVFERL